MSALEEAQKEMSLLLLEIKYTQEAIGRTATNDGCENVRYAHGLFLRLNGEQEQRITGAAEMLKRVRECQREQAQSEAAAAAAEESRKRNLIRLEGEWWYEAEVTKDGHCTYRIQPEFSNLSDRTMNYVTFTVGLINEVGDAEADLAGVTKQTLRVTGPFVAGQAYKQDDSDFALTYRCSDLRGFAVEKATIEWSNSETETVHGRYLRCSTSWGSECEG